MRWFVTFLFALSLQCAAQAQDEEKRLVDRLLRPDTTLQNNAQNKKFVAAATVVHSGGTVGTFYVQQRSREKNFAETRDFSTGEFASRSFHGGNRTTSISQKEIANSHATYSTSSVPEPRSVHDSQKSIGSRGFVAQRPFLDQGKSQKALNRQNPPLTIEQVRELLNKNK